ncbi:V-set domain-containing T-cell activation inhibitor 1-like [Seriola dumerili]|uniref:V-set domain-containing T-cell activation inhibitor 1-like n=1 Tax=Seriola dumerili TaxID=41447 RepID=UPI000BBEA348|nr:V-set domain-containing T-cell activation inhibitor 1-like [Seriola dumerili]
MTWYTLICESCPLACLCVLTWSGTTFADEHGPSVITVAVEEGSDAILPCSLSTKENIEKMVFDWKKDGDKEVFLYDAGHHYNKGRTGQDEQFNGRVFHFEDELKYGNASIKIHNTKMADNGSYTCAFPRKQVSHLRLVVDPDPERFILTSYGSLQSCAFPPVYTLIFNVLLFRDDEELMHVLSITAKETLWSLMLC